MTIRAEREQLAGAKAALGQLREQWRKHKQLCRTCRELTPIRNRYCDDGWALVKMIRQADQQVIELVWPKADPPLSLF